MISITDKHNCCGCTACASICAKGAIKMQADAEGFVYPMVDNSLCVDCGLCETVCPVVHRDEEQRPTSHPLVYAMHHADTDVWQKSSSGGAFTALTNYVFEHGGVVFGAAYDAEFRVVHSMATTPGEALKFRTSKYAQSDMSNIYCMVKEQLKSGRLVLFSGTPCQVEGLKCFLRKSYDNLITCDILCTSIPSPQFFSEYIGFIEKKASAKVQSINMKDKTIGWHKHQAGIRIGFSNGKSWFRTLETNLWNNIFISGLASRPSCFQCRFTNFNRSGDITIGDYWGIEKVHPECDDDRGVSLLLVNTPKGQELLRQIQPFIVCKESSTELCMQARLQSPVREPELRCQFWADHSMMSFQALCTKYFDYKPVGKLHAACRRLFKLLRIR